MPLRSKNKTDTFEKNCGTSCARKMGLCKHKAVILCFVMRTICIKSNACQRIWEEMSANPVDILQFERMSGMENVYKFGEAKSKNVLKPYCKQYSGDLCKACFKDKN